MPFILSLIIASALALAGCSAQRVPELVRYAPAKPVSLAGAWELDHARSDNIQQQFNAIARQLQREAERRAKAAERGQAVASTTMASGRDLYALAEMAELVTAPTLLDVVQSANEIRIKRENSFALICRTDQPPPVISVTAFGEERCGWDGHQLFFDISLPDGLNIRHRVSRSALADSLIVQTAVYSPVVREPFTVRKVFNRYDPDRAGYRCTQTLSKGLVCTTESGDR